MILALLFYNNHAYIVLFTCEKNKNTSQEMFNHINTVIREDNSATHHEMIRTNLFPILPKQSKLKPGLSLYNLLR